MQILLAHNLIEDCLKGNRLSQQQLYKHCFDFLMRICRRYVSNNDDAVDLMNQTFLKVLTNLANFRQNENFEAWISTIAIHTAIDHIRKNKRYRERVALSDDYKVELFSYDQISINDTYEINYHDRIFFYKKGIFIHKFILLVLILVNFHH